MIKDFCVNKLNGKEIIIYGAGKHGEIIANGLISSGINNFQFCDNRKSGSELLGKKIISHSDIEKRPKANIILGTGKNMYDIYSLLLQSDIEQDSIFTGKELFYLGQRDFNKNHSYVDIPKHYEYYVDVAKFFAKIESKLFLEHLDIVITERCSLRCEGCGSLMPLYCRPQNMQKDVIFSSLDRLFSEGCYVGMVDIIGGEPLLNQELLSEILISYGENSHIGAFQMITNGTIVPSQKTIDIIKNTKKMYIIFSNYGELSFKQKQAVELFNDNGIETIVESEIDINEDNNTLWIDYGEVKQYNHTTEKITKMFINCRDAKSCTTLLGNKIYICPRIAHMDNLNLIPDDKTNYVDIMDKEFNNEVIEKFYNNKKYPKGCEYCDRDSGKMVERAKQIDKK